jgi:hypothetical protein
LLHCNEYFASKNLKVDTCLFYGLLSRVSREPFSGERIVMHPHNSLYVGHPGHDERTFMSDAEQRDIAEALFEPKQSREEIKDAIKLEEARRAATVKNLYRLRSLRLSRNQASTQSKK